MKSEQAFRDRTEAGRLLAQEVAGYALRDPVVLALPRGGVPVAVEVARALQAPLDLLLVRKIGAPWQPELAIAAVAESLVGGEPELVVDLQTLLQSGATRQDVDVRVPAAVQEMARRRALYLHGRAPPALAGRTAIVVDDGIATGTTLRAALQAVARARPTRVMVAVPVAPAEVINALRQEVDQVVCLRQPAFFQAVGAHYRHFPQVEDQEVIELLQGTPGAAFAQCKAS